MHGDDGRAQPLSRGAYGARSRLGIADARLQEIIRANVPVKIAADLVTKYRKNVQYNLDATRAGEQHAEAFL